MGNSYPDGYYNFSPVTIVKETDLITIITTIQSEMIHSGLDVDKIEKKKRYKYRKPDEKLQLHGKISYTSPRILALPVSCDTQLHSRNKNPVASCANTCIHKLCSRSPCFGLICITLFQARTEVALTLRPDLEGPEKQVLLFWDAMEHCVGSCEVWPLTLTLSGRKISKFFLCCWLVMWKRTIEPNCIAY